MQKFIFMSFDFEMVSKVYAGFKSKLEDARKVVTRPLSLAEKILYVHLSPEQKIRRFSKRKILC